MHYEIDVPIRLPIHTKKSKWFYLNLNVYRNAHYFILDKAKKAFEDEIWNQVKTWQKLACIRIAYILHPGSKRKMDVANTCCIVDKFFCDTLVNAGILSDDNAEIVREISYAAGSIDKDNPHVTIKIEEIEL